MFAGSMRSLAVASIATAIFSAGSAGAATVTYTDLSLWQAAAGASLLEDFNDETVRSYTGSGALSAGGFDGFNLSGDLNGDTVAIKTGTSRGNINGTTFLGWHGSSVGPTIHFDFSSPVSAFAFDWTDVDSTDSYTLTIDGETFTNFPFVTTGVGNGFFGVVSTGTFTRATLTSTRQGGSVDNFGLDNVRTVSEAVTVVPTPAAVLPGLAMLGSLFVWRRRHDDIA